MIYETNSNKQIFIRYSVFESITNPMKSQHILYLPQLITHSVYFTLYISTVSIQSLTSLVQHLKFQLIRSLSYSYRFIQAFDLLSQFRVNRVNSSSIQILLQKIMLQLEFLNGSKGTFVSVLVYWHQFRRRVNLSLRIYSLLLVLRKDDEDARMKVPVCGRIWVPETRGWKVSKVEDIILPLAPLQPVLGRLLERVEQKLLALWENLLINFIYIRPFGLSTPINHPQSSKTGATLCSAIFNWFIIKPMTNNYETHLLKLILYLKEVSIDFQDGAKLNFDIKTDDGTTPMRDGKYVLQAGRCFIDQRVEVNINANFDTEFNYYLQSQSYIFVYVEREGTESEVEGYVNFNPFKNSLEEKEWELQFTHSLPLAKISFTSRLEVLQKSQIFLKPIQTERFDEFLRKSKNIDKSKIKTPQSSGIKYDSPKVKNAINQQNRIKRINKEKPLNKTKKIENLKTVRSDPKIVINSPNIVESRVQKTTLDYQMQRIKRKIDQQREEKVRSISKLKMDINSKVLTKEHKHLSNEVGVLRDKIRQLQRKDKSQAAQLDDLSRELQRGKQKQGQLQNTKSDLQRAIVQKDIKLKNANTTIRNLNDQIDQLSSNQRIVNRKGEVRQTIFKEQARRLEERLRQTELEFSQLMNEKNQKANDMVELQKRHQLVLKEKDHKIGEQKSKNMKLREQIVSLHKGYDLQSEENSLKMEIITRASSRYEERVREVEVILLKYENEVAELKDNLKKEKEKVFILSGQLERNQGQQLLNQKKKNHELNGEYVTLKQKLRRLENDLKQRQQRLKTAEDSLKLKSQESQKHLQKINTIQRQLTSSRQENTRKTGEIDHLKYSNTTLTDKIVLLKQKMQVQRVRKEEANYELQKHLKIFNKQKDVIEAQISEYKWSSIRQNDRISELEMKIRGLNDQALRHSEEFMTREQRMSTLDQNYQILKREHQRMQKQLKISLVRIREGAQSYKRKLSEFEEERKLRLRTEQKLQEEKKRVEKYEANYRVREKHDDTRQKNKQVQQNHKIQELQVIETQLFKKNEQLMTLKATLEMTIRELQLAKTDNQSTKNQYNLLCSQHKGIKEQIEEVMSKNNSLSAQLTTVNEKEVMLMKKIEHLKREFEEYREGVKVSLQNLVSQFYKQEMSWNIISTTLIPFPDQQLSNLQVKFVQKRNTFIVRQKQLMTDQQQNIKVLEGQLTDLRQHFEMRQIDHQKQQSQQRQKLKTLLCQSILQKNNLIEEVNNQNSEKQLMLREAQKFKFQMLARSENEEQLNGQLQLLLMEHESLKEDNLELNNEIFKLKEEEINIRGGFEQKMMEVQEQMERQTGKVRQQINEKQKLMILLQKDKVQSEQRCCRIDNQRLKFRQQYEQVSSRLKQSEVKLEQLNSQITTLHNTIKSLQMSQTQHISMIQRLQAQLTTFVQKYQTLSSNLQALQSDLIQSTIQKQKFSSQINHLKERLRQTNRMSSEKGQINKQKVEKKMQENGQLKSKVIEIESQLSMKEFYIKQKDQQILALGKEKEELKDQVMGYKTKMRQLSDVKDGLEARLRENSRDIERLEYEVIRCQQTITKGNCTILMMQQQLNAVKQFQYLLKDKQKQCIRLRQQKNQNDSLTTKEYKKMQQTISLLRRQIDSEKNYQKNIKEQHKRKLERTQNQNIQKYNFLLFQFEKEREEFNQRVSEIEEHNRAVIGDLEARLEAAGEQLKDLRDYEGLSRDEIYKREAEINKLRKDLKQVQSVLEEFRQKYNRCYLLSQQLKSQKELLLQQSHDKLSKALKQSKNHQQRTFNRQLTIISKKISKLRTTEQADIHKQSLNRREVISLLTKIFNRLDEIILENETKQGSDSFEVYRQKERQGYVY